MTITPQKLAFIEHKFAENPEAEILHFTHGYLLKWNTCDGWRIQLTSSSGWKQHNPLNNLACPLVLKFLNDPHFNEPLEKPYILVEPTTYERESTHVLVSKATFTLIAIDLQLTSEEVNLPTSLLEFNGSNVISDQNILMHHLFNGRRIFPQLFGYQFQKDNDAYLTCDPTKQTLNEAASATQQSTSQSSTVIAAFESHDRCIAKGGEHLIFALTSNTQEKYVVKLLRGHLYKTSHFPQFNLSLLALDNSLFNTYNTRHHLIQSKADSNLDMYLQRDLSVNDYHLRIGIAINLTCMIDELHEQDQVTHGDIKPTNILIDHSHHHLKLIDFSFGKTKGIHYAVDNYPLAGTDQYMPALAYISSSPKERYSNITQDTHALIRTLYMPVNCLYFGIEQQQQPPQQQASRKFCCIKGSREQLNRLSVLPLDLIDRHPFLQNRVLFTNERWQNIADTRPWTAGFVLSALLLEFRLLRAPWPYLASTKPHVFDHLIQNHHIQYLVTIYDQINEPETPSYYVQKQTITMMVYYYKMIFDALKNSIMIASFLSTYNELIAKLPIENAFKTQAFNDIVLFLLARLLEIAKEARLITTSDPRLFSPIQAKQKKLDDNWKTVCEILGLVLIKASMTEESSIYFKRYLAHTTYHHCDQLGDIAANQLEQWNALLTTAMRAGEIEITYSILMSSALTFRDSGLVAIHDKIEEFKRAGKP